jgi:hypothetical protein
MQPSDVTAVQPEVVSEVLGNPSAFLAAAAESAPGWAARYGGPEGVVQLTSVLQDHLAHLTKLNAELRASTVVYLKTQTGLSLTTLARLLGVTKGAVQHVLRRSEMGPFTQLGKREAWES